jgi:menaquinone-dependent protoporphyrinogen oxidase
MKTLIIYSSKYGYVKECVDRIKAEIGMETEVVEAKKGLQGRKISEFDLVIIGSAIYAGSTTRAVRTFCTKHEQELLAVSHLGLFLCGTDPDTIEQNFQKGFPSALLEKAEMKEWFGGRLVLSQFKGIMHAILKKMLKGEQEVHAEQPEALNRFIQRLQQL